MTRAMQALLISPDPHMRRRIVRGDKRITIREGRRDYTPGPAALFCHLQPWAVMVDIVNVRHVRLSDVTLAECRDDGFANQRELLRGLKKFYPSITSSSWVTIIRWREVRGKFVDQETLHETHLATLSE